MGGTWITRRWQPQMAAAVERYGLALEPRVRPTHVVSIAGGQRIVGGAPVSADDEPAFTAAIESLLSIAGRMTPGSPLQDPDPQWDISFSDLIRSFNVPPAVYEALAAEAINMFGCGPDQLGALSFLQWLASADADPAVFDLSEEEVFRDGTAALVDALAGEAPVEIRLGQAVRVVRGKGREGNARHVPEVETENGHTYRGRALIMAVPLNVLSTIQFRPALHPSKAAMAEAGHGGHATKVWMLVRGAPSTFLGTGLGPGLAWLGSQRELAGGAGSLLVGFGGGPGLLDVHSPEQLAHNLEFFLPGAELVRSDAHDWSADRFSRGAWLAHRPGMLSKHGRQWRMPEGRILFAGSDFATRWAGWMEGALQTGADAAEAADGLLRGSGA
jgi:monoamine oxidase